MAVPKALRATLIERAGGRCERCGQVLDIPWGYSLQHRRGRGMGSTRRPDANAAPNLAVLCGSATTGCHGWVEANPLEALEDGWRVRQGHDPASVPVRHWWRGWVLLGHGYQEAA